jgi:hypothetical protein
VTAPNRVPTFQQAGGLSNLIGDLEGRVDRVQISGALGPVPDVTEECTSDCTNSCVTCNTCISCDTCTCTCIVCEPGGGRLTDGCFPTGGPTLGGGTTGSINPGGGWG